MAIRIRHMTILFLILFLFYCVVVSWVVFFLLLCGDVHPNPGPRLSSSSSDSSFHAHDSLTVLQLNIRSIRNKMKFIENELLDFDILCFTETHLSPEFDKTEILLDGFKPFFKDRSNSGGGVMAYINLNLDAIERRDLVVPGLEMIWIEIVSRGIKFLLGIVYRSPSEPVSFWNNLNISIENAFSVSQHVLLVGDLNENLLNSNLHHLKDIININSLRNVIEEPTRITENASSLLDPILVSNEIQLLDSGVIDIDKAVSDHRLTYATFRLGYNRYQSFKRKIWVYTKADFDKLNNLINSFDWDIFFSSISDLDTAVLSFTEKIIYFAELSIPHKTVTVRPNDQPWYNNSIRRESRKRDRLKRKASRANNPYLWCKYKTTRNKVNNMIKKAKEDFYGNLENIDFKYNDQKQFWKCVRYFMKNNTTNVIPPLLKHDRLGNSEVIFEDMEKATVLNEYFTEITNLNDTDVNLPYFDERTTDVFPAIEISRTEVLETIRTLQLNKATGPDGISHRLILGAAHSICKPLSILFNLSLRKSQFPSSWKEANVVPLFKKGEHKLPSNYRPISLLSSIGKLMERIVFKHMYNFLHERKLINKYQSGFQPGHSTVFQLTEIYDRISKSLDERKYTCMVFCDISKAFDRVWHKGLLLKLTSYGFKNNFLKWLESYLTNRQQRVVLNSSKSAFLPIKSGVPQGSVLGPLLFLLYINDIADNLSSLTRLFADDSSISSSSHNLSVIENELNSDLTKLSKWAKDWLVTFNPNKTDIMLFTNRFVDIFPNVLFDNKQLQFVDTHKHLGVTLSSDGKWGAHIENLITKCTKMLGILRKLKFILSRTCLNRMYLSFVRPILEYADIVWDGMTDNQCNRLEIVQSEAARIVTGLTRSVKLESLYNEVGWAPLMQRRNEHKLINFFNIVW